MASDSGSFAIPCVPKFDGDYEHWSLVMENLLRSKEYWSAIQSSFEEPKGNEALSAAQQKTIDERGSKISKQRIISFNLLMSILKTIIQKDTTKQLWDSMKLKYQGNARVKQAQLQRLRRTFETLEMKAGEGVSEYFTRIMSTANDMRICGEHMTDIKIVEKLLQSLTDKFSFVVCSIEELQTSLFVHEQKVIDKRTEEQILPVENVPRYGQGRGRGTFQRGRGYSRGREKGRSFVNRLAINLNVRA